MNQKKFMLGISAISLGVLILMLVACGDRNYPTEDAVTVIFEDERISQLDCDFITIHTNYYLVGFDWDTRLEMTCYDNLRKIHKITARVDIVDGNNEIEYLRIDNDIFIDKEIDRKIGGRGKQMEVIDAILAGLPPVLFGIVLSSAIVVYVITTLHFLFEGKRVIGLIMAIGGAVGGIICLSYFTGIMIK